MSTFVNGMKLFLVYIFAFLFVFNTNANDFLQKNQTNKTEKTERFNPQYNQTNNIVSNYQHHNKHDFAIDIEEEEDDKLKKLLPFLFATYFHLNYFLMPEKYNSSYFSKTITSSISRYILLETFRI